MRTYWLESETNVPLITSNSLPEYNSTHRDGQGGRDGHGGLGGHGGHGGQGGQSGHDGHNVTQKIPEGT